MSPRRRQRRNTAAAVGVLALAVALVCGSVQVPRSSADTDPTTLIGEGGWFLAPVTNLLLNDDTGLGLYPAYSDTNIDNGIADFVGTGPGQFNADFAVSERPLTSAESAEAAADGRSYAYIPFAATAVAVATLVYCNQALCNNLPLTPALIGEIFDSEYTSQTVQPNTNLPAELTSWSDPRLTQAGGAAMTDVAPIGLASALGPSAENSALMALMDSDPVAKEELDNALNNPANSPSTTSDTPNEVWPFQGQHSYPGGDAGLIQHELSIVSETDAPGPAVTWGGIDGGAHDTFAIANDWTGAPLGTPLNIPTAAIQNAAGAFVGPSAASAAAAEADASFSPTSNLVTFNPSSTDTAAYNNYMMAESYLVVPLNSLPADKDVALAQFIRYVLGSTAQADMKVLGSAPATPAMVTAGLQVASELDADADSSPTTTTTTTISGGGSITTSSTTTTTPSVTSTLLPTGTVGDGYEVALQGEGGTAPYTWSLATGSTLPPGLSLAAASGVISGTPTKNGVYPFTLQMAGSGTPTQSATAHLEIDVGTLTAKTAGGSGSVVLGVYGTDPESSTPADAAGSYFDVKAATGSTFKSAVINDCGLSKGGTLEWWNAQANSGAGAWAAVVGKPGPTYKASPSACIKVTLTSTSTPTVTELTGTVFAVTDTVKVAAKKKAATRAPTTTHATTAAKTTPTSQTGGSGDGSTSSSQLAFTGFNPIPLTLFGLILVTVSEFARRRLRRRARVADVSGTGLNIRR